MQYHMSMARKEVLVQLDDEILARLDNLTSARKTSRSALIRQGIAALLDAEELRAADAELQDAYRRTPQNAAVVESALRLAAETAQDW